MKKPTALLVFVLIVSLLLSSCKNVEEASSDLSESSASSVSEASENSAESSSSTDSTSSDGETSTNSEANGETSTSSTSGDASNGGTSSKLIYLTVWADSSDSTALSEADDFSVLYPNVFVQIESPSDQSVAAYKIAVAAGNQPDAVRMDHVYITGLGESGLLIDLNNYGVSDLESSFVASCWNAVTYEDKVYGLPHDGNTIAMVYNKTLLGKWTGKNIVPSTYEDIIEIGKQNNTAGAETFTTPFFDTSSQNRMNWAAFNYFFWLWGNGGEILSSDNKTATFNSQAGVDALQQIIDLVKKYEVCDETYQESQFYNGSVGMIEMGNWCMSTITNSANTSEYGVAMLPTLKEGVPAYSGLGLYAYGISAGSEYPDITYQYLKDLCTNDEYQITYAKQFNELPVTESALANEYYSSDLWQVYVQQYRLSKSRPGVTNWDEIESIISEAVVNAITSGDPKGALDAAAVKVNNLL